MPDDGPGLTTVRSHGAAAVALLALAAPPGAGAAPWDRPDDIRAFMVMEVCVDAADQLRPGLAPGDAACTRRRKIREGEPVPYHLHNFPRADAPCRFRQGSVSKDNIPVTRNGVTRIVSYYDQGVDHDCPDATPADPAFGQFDAGREGGSVQWADDSFGFIMGSWSPVSVSYLRSPLCADHPASSQALFRGWVIAPARVTEITAAIGAAVFASKLELGSPAGTFGTCPERYNRGFSTWTRGKVDFHSGLRLEAIVASHYARADRQGGSPGESLQMERTYWTRAFGLTRWEKWGRADWVHPRNHQPAGELARALHAGGACGRGYPMRGSLGESWQVAPADTGDRYGETLADPTAGVVHLWLMTLCQDYTNIVHDADPKPPVWGAKMDAAYWQEDR